MNCSRSSFLWVSIGTISKVKKIVLGLRYKGRDYLWIDQIFLYVLQHTFGYILIYQPIKLTKALYLKKHH